MSIKLRQDILTELNNEKNSIKKNKKNKKEGFVDQADDTGTLNQLEWHRNDNKRKDFIKSSGCSQKVIKVGGDFYYITQFCDALLMTDKKYIDLWFKRYEEQNLLQTPSTTYSTNGQNKLGWGNCLMPSDDSYPVIKIVGNYPVSSSGMFLPPKLENSYTYVGLDIDFNKAFEIIKFTNKKDIEDQKYKCLNLHEINRNYRTGEDFFNDNFLKIDDSVYRLKTQPETKEECFNLMQKINAAIIIKKYINAGIKSNSIDKTNPDWDVWKFKTNLDTFLNNMAKQFVGDKLPEDEFLYFTFGKGGICTKENPNINGARLNQSCNGVFDGTTSNVELQEAFTSNEEMDTYNTNYIKKTDWIRDSKLPGKSPPINPDDINKGKKIDGGGGGIGDGVGKGMLGSGGKKLAKWQTDSGQYVCKKGKWKPLNNFCNDGGGDRALFFTKKPETLNSRVDIWPTFRYKPFENMNVPMGCWGDYAPSAADRDAEKAFESEISAQQGNCEEDQKKFAASILKETTSQITGGIFDFFTNEQEGFLFGGDDGWGGETETESTFKMSDDGLPYTDENNLTFDMDGCKRYRALKTVNDDNYNFWSWWPKAKKAKGSTPANGGGPFDRAMAELGRKNIQNCKRGAQARGFDLWGLQYFSGSSYNRNGSFKSGTGECMGASIGAKGKVYNNWHPAGGAAGKSDGYGIYNGMPGTYSNRYGQARNNGECNRLGNSVGWINKVERSNINLFPKDKCGGNTDDVAEGNVRKIYLCPQYDASNLGKYLFVDMYYGIHFINNSHRIFYKTLGRKKNKRIVTFKGITYGNENPDFDIRRSSGYYLYDKHIGINTHNAIDSYEWHNIITTQNTEGFTVENFSQEYNMDAKNKKLQEENYNVLNRLTLRNAAHSTNLKKENNVKNDFISKQSNVNQKKTDQAVSLHRIVSSLDEGFTGNPNSSGVSNDAADRLEKRLRNFFNNEITYNALHEQTTLDVKSKQAWMILWASLVIMTLSFKYYIMTKK